MYPGEHAVYFRDQLIAASLKRDRSAMTARDSSRFPRSTDRGLIEAVDPELGADRHRHFRDQLIAASLKPDCVPRYSAAIRISAIN